MRIHTLAPRTAWQMHCPPQASGGQAAAGRLLRRAPELTSLIAYNDLVAVGALRACVELGLDVPGDLAIVGCDDIPLAALVSPALTTIHIPKYDLGQQAMGLLLSMMREGDVPPGSIVLLPQLVIRDSATGPTRRPQPVAKRSLP
jgi:LacI family transcriptional regulator